MVLKIPTTNQYKLTAERVAKVVKAIARRLVQKGVLTPPGSAGLTSGKPESATPSPEVRKVPRKPTWDGVLRCAPPSAYRAFQVIEGGKSEKADAPGSLDRKREYPKETT